jgi:GNAT superfamily N-acetyltransferase
LKVDGHTKRTVATGHSETAGASLRQAAKADATRLAVVMARAFHDDPVFGWLMPDAGRRPARLRRFFGIELRHMALQQGQVWTTGDFSGAAMVMPPGKWRVPLHVTLLEGRAFGAGLGRAARLGMAMEWRHAREARGPHYYVRDVGVFPEMQGRGLGSALMAPTLERSDRDGLPTYLEASSERSAALYERLGFEHVAELSVLGSPPLRLMLRPSAAS